MMKTMASVLTGAVLAALVTHGLVQAMDSPAEPASRPLYNYGTR